MSTLRVPIPTVDDTSHVSSLFGGVQFYWAEESRSLTESQATFGRVVLDAKKLVGFFKVPNELLADAPAFCAWFDTRIPRAWLVRGRRVHDRDRRGHPAGLHRLPGLRARSTRAASNEIAWCDLVAMYARMLPTSLNNGGVGRVDRHVPAARAADPVHAGYLDGRLQRARAADAPPVTIMGRPVYFTEKVRRQH